MDLNDDGVWQSRWHMDRATQRRIPVGSGRSFGVQFPKGMLFNLRICSNGVLLSNSALPMPV